MSPNDPRKHSVAVLRRQLSPFWTARAGRWLCRGLEHKVSGLICGHMHHEDRCLIFLVWTCERCGFTINRTSSVQVSTVPLEDSTSLLNKVRMEMYLDILHELNKGRASMWLRPYREIPPRLIEQMIPQGGIELVSGKPPADATRSK